MTKYYHATPYSNLHNILSDGLQPGPDGLVYMCETPVDALKFLVVRGYKDLLVVEIKIYKNMEKNVIETFDHSERFFKCRAFGYNGSLFGRNIGTYTRYQL